VARWRALRGLVLSALLHRVVAIRHRRRLVGRRLARGSGCFHDGKAGSGHYGCHREAEDEQDYKHGPDEAHSISEIVLY
jgi:hypothetical protein